MSLSDNTPLNQLALHTLDLLESRLKRLEFLLNGSTDDVDSDSDDAADEPPLLPRLNRLEQSLRKLARDNDTVAALLSIHAHHPELFKPSSPSRDLPNLPLDQKLATIIAAAPSYHTTASQLRALSDTNLPPSSSFATWTALSPRIALAARRQSEQDAEIAELRRRSAALVTRWHEVDVLAQGRCWVEWEARVKKVEREAKRLERRRVEATK